MGLQAFRAAAQRFGVPPSGGLAYPSTANSKTSNALAGTNILPAKAGTPNLAPTAPLRLRLRGRRRRGCGRRGGSGRRLRGQIVLERAGRPVGPLRRGRLGHGLHDRVQFLQGLVTGGNGGVLVPAEVVLRTLQRHFHLPQIGQCALDKHARLACFGRHGHRPWTRSRRYRLAGRRSNRWSGRRGSRRRGRVLPL
jgi:hypothetical protein